MFQNLRLVYGVADQLGFGDPRPNPGHLPLFLIWTTKVPLYHARLFQDFCMSSCKLFLCHINVSQVSNNRFVACGHPNSNPPDLFKGL